MIHLLDNPIFNSLTGVDQRFNAGTNQFPYFIKEVAPFIGLENWDQDSQREMIQNIPKDRTWYLLIKEQVSFIEELNVLMTFPATQMVYAEKPAVEGSKSNYEIMSLSEENVQEMIALTALTRPGPFSERTIDFGNYYGIFLKGKLAAMGGERMHAEEFVEVSAICTHPDFRGLGLGKIITQFVTEKIYERGKTPFLHARADNQNAIEIYKKLGFEERAKMNFYAFKSI